MLCFTILQSAFRTDRRTVLALADGAETHRLLKLVCCRHQANSCLEEKLLSTSVAANLEKRSQHFSLNNAVAGIPCAKISSPCTQAFGRVCFLAI